MIGASGSLLLALSWGGHSYPWSSPQVIGLFVASAVAWALLVWRQMTAAEPLIPLRVLENQVALTSTMTMFFMMGAYLALNIYLPIFFQTLGGMSASESGMALIPLLLFTSAGAWVASRLMPRTAHYKRLPLAGLIVSSLAAFAMAIWPQMHIVGVLAATTIIAIGTGTVFPVVSVAVQASSPRHLLGSTMALSYFVRRLARRSSSRCSASSFWAARGLALRRSPMAAYRRTSTATILRAASPSASRWPAFCLRSRQSVSP